ncbi:hypothetical protein AVEN_171975-1 [Araneus ventricosus]|uniref:Uncharacterized protein n=1 Tax=Araneus ventricosus TaxID=182803 RepID=A0A4Y2WDB4_ARAVE|nr:hypothetical protein AVEN_171975-1 [Araneus ventricosus]
MNDLPPRILIRALWSTHYSPIKPSIHRHSFPLICPNTDFFLPPIQVQKSDTSIHLKFQSALLVGDSDLFPPSTAALRAAYYFLHSADFRFATLVAGSRSSQID